MDFIAMLLQKGKGEDRTISTEGKRSFGEIIQGMLLITRFNIYCV